MTAVFISTPKVMVHNVIFIQIGHLSIDLLKILQPFQFLVGHGVRSLLASSFIAWVDLQVNTKRPVIFQWDHHICEHGSACIHNICTPLLHSPRMGRNVSHKCESMNRFFDHHMQGYRNRVCGSLVFSGKVILCSWHQDSIMS